MRLKSIKALDGFKFYYPDGEYLDQFIADIFSGKEYPILYSDDAEVSTVVDIGAHVGATLRYLISLFPNASFIAFEPNPPSYELLVKNIEKPGRKKRVRLENYALGAEESNLDLFQGAFSTMQASLLPNKENSEKSFRVSVKNALDAFSTLNIKNADILKLDTEGMELAIMDSLSSLLSSIKYILVEYHSDRDRVIIEERLLETHSLYFSNVFEPDRGTLCYILSDYMQSLRTEKSIKNYAFPKQPLSSNS